MPSFEDLPYELVSEILSITADLNANDPDMVTYSYGLTQAPRPPPHNKTHIQKYVRGRVPTDILRWNSVDAIRQVNSRWHHWALSHALQELYIRRWQGGETWIKSNFDNALAVDHLPVVYQNPYKSVHCTAKLFHDYPQLAYHVRKIWFNGIYSSDTVSNVFAILKNCINLRTVTVPWTALRYGGSQEWGNVLSFPRLTSLELLAVPLKGQVCAMPNMHTDSEVLLGQDSSPLDFRNLRRLKIFGDSNLKPINDEDLILMAKTATNLEEILITNVSTVTIRGITALVSASRNSLKLLEFIPLAEGGFEPPLDPTNNASSLSSSNASDDDMHICSLLASCPHLKDLAVTLPCACPELFSNPRVHWDETVRVRVGSSIIRGRDVEDLAALLESARTLLEQKRKDGNELRDIEIAVGPYIFETKARLVHGNYKEAKMLSEDMRWQPVEISSVKGPYGYTGLYGGGMKGEWTAILECDFLEAVAAGLVHLDS